MTTRTELISAACRAICWPTEAQIEYVIALGEDISDRSNGVP